MHLSFGMGFFWLLIAWAAGDTIVKTAQALSKRGSRKDSPSADLERRVSELEQRVVEQADLLDAREKLLTHLEQRVEFTNRLLSNRDAPTRE